MEKKKYKTEAQSSEKAKSLQIFQTIRLKVEYLTQWKGHEGFFLDKLSGGTQEMLRIKCVWLFPLCLVPKYRGEQSDDLCALKTEVLLMTEITFLLKKVAL